MTLPSAVQVNANFSAPISTKSSVVKLCAPMVNTITPVAGLYVALVTSCFVWTGPTVIVTASVTVPPAHVCVEPTPYWHENETAPSSNLTSSPFFIPWAAGVVIVMIPTTGS